jgi:hypothetical protein
MLEKIANSHNRTSLKNWTENNKVIFEPQNPEEEKRPAVSLRVPILRMLN